MQTNFCTSLHQLDKDIVWAREMRDWCARSPHTERLQDSNWNSISGFGSMKQREPEEVQSLQFPTLRLYCETQEQAAWSSGESRGRQGL